MKRSLFLVSLGAVAGAASTRRIASAQTASAHARIIRRPRTRKIGEPGRCTDHRRKARWSSYTAADFV